MADKHTVTERLAWTADKSRLVPYGHCDAAFLAYRPGDVIPLAAAEAAGLVKAKEAEPPEDKMAAAPENKGVAKRKRGRPKAR